MFDIFTQKVYDFVMLLNPTPFLTNFSIWMFRIVFGYYYNIYTLLFKNIPNSKENLPKYSIKFVRQNKYKMNWEAYLKAKQLPLKPTEICYVNPITNISYFYLLNPIDDIKLIANSITDSPINTSSETHIIFAQLSCKNSSSIVECTSDLNSYAGPNGDFHVQQNENIKYNKMIFNNIIPQDNDLYYMNSKGQEFTIYIP